jgi:hypothetical protein
MLLMMLFMLLYLMFGERDDDKCLNHLFPSSVAFCFSHSSTHNNNNNNNKGKPRIDGAIYYYLVIEGECTMTKDGIKVLGPTKGMKRGESFGETDFLFGNTLSSHTVIASKTGKVVLCRLKDTLYDYHITLDVKVKLQRHMSEICNVMDVLSGVNTKNSNAAIIHPYIPSELWLLRQWDGTVLQYVWQKVVMMMIFSALFSIAIYFIPGGEFALLGVEDGDGDGGGGMAAIDEQLDYIKGFWEKLLPLASFVSAFFLNEAYKHWRDFYWTCRGMLGKFNDISVAMAVAAARTEEEENDKKDNLTKSLTAGARKALEDIAHIQRLTHLLFWCTTVDRFNCILSPEGLSYLRMKHFMTQSEYTSMIQVCKKNLGAYNAGFTWLVSRIATAVKNGDIVADKMISPNYSLLELRSLMARIDSLNSARMVRSCLLLLI